MKTQKILSFIDDNDLFMWVGLAIFIIGVFLPLIFMTLKNANVINGDTCALYGIITFGMCFIVGFPMMFTTIKTDKNNHKYISLL